MGVTRLAAGLAVAMAAAPAAGEVMRVTLDALCAGQAGEGIATYSWFGVNSLVTKEHVLTDICLDLDARRAFGVEDSDVFLDGRPSWGEISYPVDPAQTGDPYATDIGLRTNQIDAGGFQLSAPRPDDPDVPAHVTWAVNGAYRTLNHRDGLTTVRIDGMVGGPPLGTVPATAEYEGYGAARFDSMSAPVRVSGIGLGFDVTAQLVEGRLTLGMSETGESTKVTRAEARLTLDVAGGAVDGTGTYEAESSGSGEDAPGEWRSATLEAAGVSGRIFGAEGEHLHVVVVWQGETTSFDGSTAPVQAAMELYLRRPD